MGELTECPTLSDFREHLIGMPKDRILFDDETKLFWKRTTEEDGLPQPFLYWMMQWFKRRTDYEHR